MKESALGGPPRESQESKDFVPDELPEIESTTIDKEAITERILDRVIGAAEVNRPLEQEYETAHERKDAPNKTYLQTPMQSIGDIINSSSQTQTLGSQQSVDPSLQQTNTPSQSDSSPSHATTSLMSYKNAIKYGFITAVVAAVLIVVITGLS